MAILPAEVPTGLVTGQFYFVSEDNIDADTDPELLPVTGDITFTSSAKVLRMPGAKVTVIPRVFKAKFDAMGNIRPANASEPGLKLPATDTTEISPRNYTWKVEFDLKETGNNYTVQVPSFDIQVPAGTTVDLTTVMPVDQTPGTITIMGPPGATGPAGSLEIGTVETLPGTPLDDEAIAYEVLNGPETVAALNATIQGSEYLDAAFVPAYASEAPIAPVAPRLPSKLILGTQSGHAWVDTGSVGGTTVLNDTTNFMYGTQSVARLSNGAGGASRLQRLGGPATDFTDRHLSISMELENLPKIGLLTIYAASGDLSNHHFKWDLKPPVGIGWFLAEGRWATLTLNFAEAVKVGTPNQAAITDYRITVTDDNTGQAVQLRLGKVDSIPRGTRWPYGVSTISMDDGFASQLEMIRYGANLGIRGTIYVIAELIGQAGYLSMADLHTIQDDLGWEIGAHALTVNAHNNRMTSLTPDQLEAELSGLKMWLRKNNLLAAGHFCYPAGIFNGPVLDAVKKHFPGSARGTFSQAQEILPPVERHLMRAKSLGASTTLAQAKASVDLAYSAKGWSHLYGHIYGDTASSITWTKTDMRALFDYIAAKGIATATVGEVLNAQYTA